MRQIYENEFEKIVSQDINNMQLAVHKSLFDDTLYPLFGEQNGVIAPGFAPSYVSAYAASLAAGVGFFYDSTQTGFNPNYRMIQSTAVIPVAFATADPSNNRIDLVVLSPNYNLTASASRFVKVGGTGPVALQTVPKTYQDSYTLTVVEGTPASSPVAPSTPAGSIAIAQCLIHAATGLTGSGDITDVRNPLGISEAASAVSATNTSHNIMTGTTVQAQLDEADAAMSESTFNIPYPNVFISDSAVLPAALAGSQLAVISGYIYLFGGFNSSGTATNKIYKCPVGSPLSGWTDTGATLPGNLAASSLVIVGTNMYLIGGVDATSSSVKVIYTATLAAPTVWTDTGDTLPAQLSDSHVAVIGSSIYLFGGYNLSGVATNVIYTATVAAPTTWSTMAGSPTLPDNVAQGSLAVIGDTIYIFGGFNASNDTVNVILMANVYNPGVWVASNDTLLDAIGATHLAIIGDRVWLYGGFVTSSEVYVIYSASLSTPTKWTLEPQQLPAAIERASLAIVGSQVFLFGGIVASSEVATAFSTGSYYTANKINTWSSQYGADAGITSDGVLTANTAFCKLGYPQWKNSNARSI